MYSLGLGVTYSNSKCFLSGHYKVFIRSSLELDTKDEFKRLLQKVFTLLDISWKNLKCLNFVRWHQLFGLMLKTRFEEWSVPSVDHWNKNVLGHCAWFVLFAWTELGRSHHAWTEFSFPLQRQENGSHSSCFSSTFSWQCHSHEENGVTNVKSFWCWKLCLVTGALASPIPTSSCVRNAGTVMTILSIPQSKVIYAGSLAFSVKPIFTLVLLRGFSADCASVMN